MYGRGGRSSTTSRRTISKFSTRIRPIAQALSGLVSAVSKSIATNGAADKGGAGARCRATASLPLIPVNPQVARLAADGDDVDFPVSVEVGTGQILDRDSA